MSSTSINQSSASTTDPILKYVSCPGASKTDAQAHRMAYWSWGDESNPNILMCVHGLSRQGRDFDTLARSLSDRYQVICPDVVATEPIDIDWIGTSMGGLIGLGFSTLPPQVSGVKLRKFVLNDVGPRLNHAAMVRIGEYLGQPMRFESEQKAADYLWTISTGFGPHTPEQWLALSRPLLRPAPDGNGLGLHYDPAIAEPFKTMSADAATSGEAMLWQVYDALSCRVLLMRGKNSDLLDHETAQTMTQRGPKAKLIEFEGIGHAPTLQAADQLAAIKDFLLA